MLCCRDYEPLFFPKPRPNLCELCDKCMPLLQTLKNLALDYKVRFFRHFKERVWERYLLEPCIVFLRENLPGPI